MRLIIATTNSHKFHEVAAIMRPLLPDTVTLEPLDANMAGNEPDENGVTFEANARLKAEHYAAQTGMACLSDDSGICVDALNGAPGIQSSRYAPNDAARIKKLLGELEYAGAYDADERTARFVCSAVAVLPGGDSLAAEGVCEGVIAKAPSGGGGFGYDPIFFLPELGCTVAELAASQKNELSHRGKAMRALATQLNARLA